MRGFDLSTVACCTQLCTVQALVRMSVLAVQLWVEHLTSLGMLEFLLLGFELGLYVSSEYKTVFGFCMRVLDLQQASLQRLCAARPKEFKPSTKKNKQKSGASTEPELTNGTEFAELVRLIGVYACPLIQVLTELGWCS